MSVGFQYNIDPEFTTTNGVITDAFTIAVEPGNTCAVKIDVFARGYADAASAMWSITGCIKSVNGVLSAVPAGIVHIFAARKDTAASGWDVTFAIVGHSIVVRVTGSTTQSVGWSIRGFIDGINNYNFGGVV